MRPPQYGKDKLQESYRDQIREKKRDPDAPQDPKVPKVRNRAPSRGEDVPLNLRMRALVIARVSGFGIAARITGYHRTVIERWAAQWKDEEPDEYALIAEDRERRRLVDDLEALAFFIVDLLPAELAHANAGQLAMALGVVTDKMRLLRGEPTQILQATMSPDDRRTRIVELLRIADIRSGAIGPTVEPPKRGGKIRTRKPSPRVGDDPEPVCAELPALPAGHGVDDR